MSTLHERDQATRELVQYCTARPLGDDRFAAEGPDWFGERVFGGVIVAQALSAAMQTTERPVHSLHGYFLRPERANEPIELAVERVRDGRTFSTRRVVITQDNKDVFHATCSFHGGDDGDEYQMTMPSVPAPDELPPSDWAPPPFEVRDAGSVKADDGTYVSTRRVWERSGDAGDDPVAH